MKRIEILLASVFLALSFSTAYASEQNNTVLVGRVIDAKSRQPLTGATITVADKSAGTIADIDGNFTLRVNGDYPLDVEFSFMGYASKTISFDAPASGFTVELDEDESRIQEIVVIGYTQGVKNALTSATTIVQGEALDDIVGSSVSDKLQGAAPGLMVSKSGGIPGSASLVRLRGATSISASNNPIYIVDGVFINTDNLGQTGLGGLGVDPLSDLNPDDIETVSVLKDAAATAAYGARAANGVIIINTKRGSKNTQTKVNFKAQLGVANTRNTWELVTGEEHANIVNQCWVNDGKSYETRPFRAPDGNTTYKAYGTPESQQTYDRLSDIFRTALQQTYGISVSGGNEATNLFAGIDYTSQESTLVLTDFSRLSLRLNLDHNIRKNLKLGVSTNISNSARSLVRVGNGPAGLFQAALHTPTYEPVYNEDGSYNKPVAFDNHMAIIDNWDGGSTSFHVLASAYLQWKITDALSFKSSFSDDRTYYKESFYYNTNLIYGQPNGTGVLGQNLNNVFSEEQVLNYLKIFGRHSVSAFAGTSYQRTSRETSYITGTGYPSNDLKTISSAAEQTASATSTGSSILSFFGGANYSYDSRYSVDLTMRADGSSRFGRNNRFGYFPAIGFAWNVMNESFFHGGDTVGKLRVKASIGLGGNENIGDFASRSLWTGGSNYNGSAGLSPYQLGNPDLKWETTRQIDFGVQTSLFNNRIDIDLDYYDKYTTGLLLDKTVPWKSGFTSIVSNSGEISNRGIELSINSLNISRDDFTWRSTFTLSHNKNTVEKLPVDVSGNYTMFKLFEGKPLYSMWVYKYLGVDPQTGDAVYQDTNNDGKITSDDKVVVGDAWPDVEGIFKNTFSWKGLSLDVSFYYKYGNEIFNYTRMFLESGGSRGTTRSMQKSSTNYWTEPVDSDELLTDILPRPKSTANADGSYNYEGQSSRCVEDASFIRLRDLTISYNLPSSITSKMSVSKAAVRFTGSNLLTLTKYTGPDPEVNLEGDGSRTLDQGMDFGMPPQPVSFLMGLNLTF